MKSILIIGIGRFGYHVAIELNKLGCQILAVDNNEDHLKKVDKYVSKTLIGNGTDLDFIKTLGINTFDDCIVTVGDDFQSSLEIVYNLKELGAKRITARASKESQKNLLTKIGADLVVYPEKQLARWTALHCGASSIDDFMDLDNKYGVYEVKTPKEWVGKTLAELDLRKKHHINIVGVKANNKMTMILGPNYTLKENENLVAIAQEEDANKFFNNQ